MDDNPTTFTIGGSAAGSLNLSITINGHTAAYTTSGTDTLQTIANNLTYQINQLGVAGISANVAGTVISVAAPPGSTFADSPSAPVTITQGSTPASTGCPRPSWISYPNGMLTSLSYLPNIGDQRIQQIANVQFPSATTLSQFNHAYNAAGEMTQWLQIQNGGQKKHFSLGYDLASQLIAATSDTGSTINAYISGTVHAGDVVSITGYDASLTGTTPQGQEAASYTVQSGDTASTIASNLVHNGSSTGLNDVMGSNLGVSASSSGAVITISQSSSAPIYCTQFTCAVTGSGATDTISLGASGAKPNLHKQQYFNYDCLGNRTGVQGDSDLSLNTSATQYLYNNVNELTGSAAGGPIRFQGTYAKPVKSAVVNAAHMTITAPTGITNGDVLKLIVHDKSLSSPQTFSYTVNTAVDTSTTLIATHFVTTNSAGLAAIGVSASSAANVVSLGSSSVNVTCYISTLSTGATEVLSIGSTLSNAGVLSPSNAFVANPVLAGNTTTSVPNAAPVTAVSGGGTSATSTNTITITSAASQTQSYDANGNLLGDGTNTYAWDAENVRHEVAYMNGLRKPRDSLLPVAA